MNKVFSFSISPGQESYEQARASAGPSPIRFSVDFVSDNALQFCVVWQVSGLLHTVEELFLTHQKALTEVGRIRKEEDPDVMWIVVFQDREISQIQKQPIMNA